MKSLRNYVANVLAVIRTSAWIAGWALRGKVVIWHIYERSDDMEICWQMYELNAYDAIHSNTPTGPQE